MNNNMSNFTQSVQGLAKNPLGIIALFIVLVYGFASLIVAFANNIKDHIGPLIYFLIGFPIIVFIGFLWLVSKHYNKLYAPTDFKNDDSFLKMHLSAATSLAAATAKRSAGDTDNNCANIEDEMYKIIDLVSHTAPVIGGKANRRNRILWIDENFENNSFEKQAFSAIGITVDQTTSASDAIKILKDNKYLAIISDMGKNEETREGYILLDSIRSKGIYTPFFLYADSSLYKNKLEAQSRGAQGSTSHPQELFRMVTSSISNLIS